MAKWLVSDCSYSSTMTVFVSSNINNDHYDNTILLTWFMVKMHPLIYLWMHEEGCLA